MPAPVSESFAACSSRVTRKPERASISAVVSPPIPAPETMTLRDDATARAPERSGRFGQGTGLWPRRVGIQSRIVPVQRRAIGADDLLVVAHIEEDMRMIVGRPRTDAHE